MDNFQYIGHGFYLVRTQAGYKQAIKHYIDEPNKTWEEIKNHSLGGEIGFPAFYPAIVELSVHYRCVFDLICVTLNFDLINHLHKMATEIYVSDKILG